MAQSSFVSRVGAISRLTNGLQAKKATYNLNLTTPQSLSYNYVTFIWLVESSRQSDHYHREPISAQFGNF
jgi:hypothetical protein